MPTAASTLAFTTIAALTACAATSAPDLDHAESVAVTCPTDKPVAAFLSSDESGTNRGSTSAPAQQRIIRQTAERAAVCGGSLRVSVFSGSVVTVPVFNGELHLEGATKNARLRKAPAKADEVMDQISEALPGAVSKLSAGATDIVGQLGLVAEFRDQLSPDRTAYAVQATVLTDGIQTAQVSLADLSLTIPQAKHLAEEFTVPDLAGAHVRIVGVGRKADGEQLPTTYVDALKAFHLTVCKRTNAAQCTVVTDAAQAGA
jgi:hypothetical protein